LIYRRENESYKNTPLLYFSPTSELYENSAKRIHIQRGENESITSYLLSCELPDNLNTTKQNIIIRHKQYRGENESIKLLLSYISPRHLNKTLTTKSKST